MPSERPIQRFSDIVNNVDVIGRYTAGMSCEQFFGDEKTRDATLHCLLRISEAARKLGKTAEELVPSLPWRSIRDLGNWLRHQYDALDREQIWAVISEDLTPLREACEDAIRRLQAGQGGSSD